MYLGRVNEIHAKFAGGADFEVFPQGSTTDFLAKPAGGANFGYFLNETLQMIFQGSLVQGRVGPLSAGRPAGQGGWVASACAKRKDK